MASKYRPRNPLKPTTGPTAGKCPIPTKPHTKFTGKGEEAITGKGGGWLCFQDGKLRTSAAATLERRWTLEDSAFIVRHRAILGVPPDGEESIRLAGGLLEAATTGDHEMFNRIAEVIRAPQEYSDKISPSLESRDHMVMDAVCKAARNARGVPTVQDVGAILLAIPSADGAGRFFTTADRSDKVREMLEKIGFGWLPGKKQGEHLRREVP